MAESANMIDFSSVLAAGVHDMKNSLCLLMQSIETLGQQLPKNNKEYTHHLASLQYEASRLNTGLMQLLSLYRAEKKNLPISIDEHFVEDLVDDILATNESYIANKKITLDIDQQAEGPWYMDVELINVLLNDILINAMRYSKEHLKLSTYFEDDFLCIRIEDDGPGYPESMLIAGNTDMQEFNISTGRTGLGLFFARLIAQAHQMNGNSGSITLENGGSLGGSVFILKLP
ncbi:HAMP domain-containing sensor histidine kinase [Aliiglaciecola sp. CAU 1673]|uniref:sensor histidine kinase n=1 Tax=Aliiglaciecola sp. CAU 1673 TaxID=3032595 RepID=UPI0023DC0373|nr:HAMP domain-containing sensor histidine kinase [Aliiglaciecola sp. CAU 1673]MDF2179782.1 HAMP domain-containing sensor histidine kinase [Aliiglaciecola sp. CAU 1673]